MNKHTLNKEILPTWKRKFNQHQWLAFDKEIKINYVFYFPCKLSSIMYKLTIDE
jgi:hypothetical protein